MSFGNRIIYITYRIIHHYQRRLPLESMFRRGGCCHAQALLTVTVLGGANGLLLPPPTPEESSPDFWVVAAEDGVPELKDGVPPAVGNFVSSNGFIAVVPNVKPGA